VIFLKPFNHYF